MKCIKCGSDLNPNSPFCGICGEPIAPQVAPMALQTVPVAPTNVFCGSCGNSVPIGMPICPGCGNLMERPKKKGIKEKLGDIFAPIIKHKVKILAVLVILLLVGGGLYFYLGSIDHTKLSWDTEFGDYESTHIMSGTISLKANASDKENPNKEVTYTVSAGEIVIDEEDKSVSWVLPTEPGKYTITATAGKKQKITKDIIVVTDDFELLKVDLKRPANYEAEKEPNYPTNKKWATDEEFTYSTSAEGISISVVGLGDMWTTTIDISHNPTLKQTKGTLPTVYDINTEGRMTQLKMTIAYDAEELEALGIHPEDLSIYRFDISTKALTKLPSVVDTENMVVKADETRTGKYILADQSIVNPYADINVMFVIDNSVTMYSEEQLLGMGYKNFSGTKSSDTEFRRLEITEQLINLFSGNYNFSIMQFAGDVKTEQVFTGDKAAAKASLDRLRKPFNGAQGTGIAKALTNAIEGFKKDEKNSDYIILMTDGKENIGDIARRKADIITNAQAKGIRICVIAFGELDKEISEITKATGCDIYNATAASTVEEIYRFLGSTLNYGLIDLDNDGKADGTIVADSGFLVTRDGFSFPNFATVQNPEGRSYGMTLFASLYYQTRLPYSLDDIDKEDNYFGDTSWDRKKAAGYILRDTYFIDNRGNKTGSNIYDYRFLNEALQILMYKPFDYRNKLTNDEYLVRDEYYTLLDALGVSIKLVDYSGTNEGIKKYQSLTLNTESPSLRENIESEEFHLIRAFDRLGVTQYDDTRISFLKDPNNAFNTLMTDLISKKPVLLSVNDEYAVLAIRVISDNNDSNKFRIEVYDPNYPGETKFIEVTRTKYNLVPEEVEEEIDPKDDWDQEFSFKFTYEGKSANIKIHKPTIQ